MAEFAIGRPVAAAGAGSAAGAAASGRGRGGGGAKKRYSLASMSSRRSLLEGLGRSTASDVGAAAARSKRCSLASGVGSQRSLVFEGFGSATDVQGATLVRILEKLVHPDHALFFITVLGLLLLYP